MGREAARQPQGAVPLRHSPAGPWRRGLRGATAALRWLFSNVGSDPWRTQTAGAHPEHLIPQVRGGPEAELAPLRSPQGMLMLPAGDPTRRTSTVEQALTAFHPATGIQDALQARTRCTPGLWAPVGLEARGGSWVGTFWASPWAFLALRRWPTQRRLQRLSEAGPPEHPCGEARGQSCPPGVSDRPRRSLQSSKDL